MGMYQEALASAQMLQRNNGFQKNRYSRCTFLTQPNSITKINRAKRNISNAVTRCLTRELWISLTLQRQKFNVSSKLWFNLMSRCFVVQSWSRETFSEHEHENKKDKWRHLEDSSL